MQSWPLPLLDVWSRRSQQGSRRNAMLATTELTRLRIERDEVEAFLAQGPRHATEVTLDVAAR